MVVDELLGRGRALHAAHGETGELLGRADPTAGAHEQPLTGGQVGPGKGHVVGPVRGDRVGREHEVGLPGREQGLALFGDRLDVADPGHAHVARDVAGHVDVEPAVGLSLAQPDPRLVEGDRHPQRARRVGLVERGRLARRGVRGGGRPRARAGGAGRLDVDGADAARHQGSGDRGRGQHGGAAHIYPLRRTAPSSQARPVDRVGARRRDIIGEVAPPRSGDGTAAGRRRPARCWCRWCCTRRRRCPPSGRGSGGPEACSAPGRSRPSGFS